MTSSEIRSSSAGSRITDLVVLSASFLLFALVTGIVSFGQVVIDLFCYVAIVFVSLRLSKRLIFGHVQSSSRIANVLLGNISGLLAGALLVILTNQFLPQVHISLMVIVFSSIMSFFILGTLSPMVKSSQRDIIHH